MPAGPWGCAPLTAPPLQAEPSAASVKVPARATHGRADSQCPLLVGKSIFKNAPGETATTPGHPPIRLADAGLDFGLGASREDSRMAMGWEKIRTGPDGAHVRSTAGVSSACAAWWLPASAVLRPRPRRTAGRTPEPPS